MSIKQIVHNREWQKELGKLSDAQLIEEIEYNLEFAETYFKAASEPKRTGDWRTTKADSIFGYYNLIQYHQNRIELLKRGIDVQAHDECMRRYYEQDPPYNRMLEELILLNDDQITYK